MTDHVESFKNFIHISFAYNLSHVFFSILVNHFEISLIFRVFDTQTIFFDVFLLFLANFKWKRSKKKKYLYILLEVKP